MTRKGHRQEGGGGGGGRTARARAEAGQHGGEGDDAAEDDGDQEDGAVHHGHLGHEEHRLDERDDQGPSVPAPRRTVSARAVRGWASNARRYARSRWQSKWATGPVQSNVVGPGSKGSLPIA